MTEHDISRVGLSAAEAAERRARYGPNELTPAKKAGLPRKILHILGEPMFLLLLAAAVIYFILGEPRDGAVMLVFVLGIIGIDVVQEWKTDKTLTALRDLSAPHIPVIRDGKESVIPSAELVPGDWMLLCEGVKIPADGVIRRCSDLCVDESSLTGESEGVWKQPEGTGEVGEARRRSRCYAGTLVVQGTAAVEVEATGAATVYGRIGGHVAEAPEAKTPLQTQTGKLVKLCAGIAAVLFAAVGFITWLRLPNQDMGSRFIESVLSGITLAMAMIPEEFPVILTVFLSMGAWRLAKKKSLVRRLPSVETLGQVSVLCVDKTGTLTENRMSVRETWAVEDDEDTLCGAMGLACETEAYDPMEKAMLARCEARGMCRERLFSGELIREYAFTSERKMMGHVWRRGGELLLAAKGAPESLLPLCTLSEEAGGEARERAEEMAARGLRVIAVGTMEPENEDAVPENLEGCRLTLRGLIGLADPLRDGVGENIAQCRKAGIRVILITGDNGVTAASIGRQAGIEGERVLTGAELDGMSAGELREAVKTTGIFSRVMPEHKMRIVQALRANGDVVAMTGDGVNDAPALKHADIGIAMGARGAEVTREAADLILLDDNFATIVDTVRDGRRIFDNIRKAVGYVFAIHIPIALASLLAPLLGASPACLFLLPLHVVLLELLIDPTCSVVLERQPEEADIMSRPPRSSHEKLVNARMLVRSALQGLTVFAASFGAYWYLLPAGAPEARSMGLAVLILSNLLLVLVGSSETESVFRTLRRLARDKVMWAAFLGTAALLPVILYTPLHRFLKLAPLSAGQLLLAAALGVVSVVWYEAVKWWKRRCRRQRHRCSEDDFCQNFQ